MLQNLHPVGPLLGTQKQPTSPEGVALRWMARRAAELHQRVRDSAWEQLSALCNVQPPVWLPPSLAEDYSSLVELA